MTPLHAYALSRYIVDDLDGAAAVTNGKTDQTLQQMTLVTQLNPYLPQHQLYLLSTPMPIEINHSLKILVVFQT
jgi:hypothetical protein